MRKTVLISGLMVAMMAGPMMAEKPKVNPADYTITVHVVGSQGGSTAIYQHLEVTIDGQYLELQGAGSSSTRTGVLALGDYKAKVTKEINQPSKSNMHDLFEAYELLFSDGTTRYYEVVGLGPAGPMSTNAASNP